jgi:hypothetical protein
MLKGPKSAANESQSREIVLNWNENGCFVLALWRGVASRALLRQREKRILIAILLGDFRIIDSGIVKKVLVDGALGYYIPWGTRFGGPYRGESVGTLKCVLTNEFWSFHLPFIR